MYDAQSSVEAKLSSVIQNGDWLYGGLPGLKLWWRSKLGFLKLVWALVTNLFGLHQKEGFMLVHILGILLERKESRLIDGSWFGFPWPFLNILSFVACYEE